MAIKSLKQLAAITTLVLSPLSHGAYINGAVLFSSFDWSKSAGSVALNNEQIVASMQDLNGETGLNFDGFSYSPFAPSAISWQSDHFIFKMTSLTVINETRTTLNAEGAGLLIALDNSWYDTYASWSFSGGSINWSYAAIALGEGPRPSAVPIPAAGWLFGVALLGLRGIKRRA
ncbi:VPLPA-CTERM sorting domain-containing protein [Oceanicoccus sagamiensis]|uniref:PEP-CTERM protein-sorting domain-containing protein n=1 Tax=Oceanicoccus sagamiensis TaxID=716816 RepID=A0A1X9NDK1_9GAMM|nr:VPLPA-CTERM sorting domain-containing protein [Oceanicoccus sagamiensis]ARN75134.1 hypothetical protein BST96_14020 [Oceanicoccus sagamiensis]